MEYNRKLIDYLPYVIADTEEFKQLTSAEDYEIYKLWQNIDKLKNESFVVSAENIGLNRMQKICKLSGGGLTADERRRAIISKLMGDRPYTMSTLYKRLKILCGNGFIFTYGKNPYSLFISIDISNKQFLNHIRNMLLKCTPANIGLTGGLSYNNTVKLYSKALFIIKKKVIIGENVTASVLWKDIKNKPKEYIPSEHIHDITTQHTSGFAAPEFIEKLNNIQAITPEQTNDLLNIIGE